MTKDLEASKCPLEADPLYIRFIAERVASGSLLLDEPCTVPVTLDAEFDRIWLALPRDHDFLLHRILGVLALLREPATDEMIVSILGNGSVYPDEVVELRRPLAPWLIFTDYCYTLSHDRLRTYLVGDLCNLRLPEISLLEERQFRFGKFRPSDICRLHELIIGHYDNTSPSKLHLMTDSGFRNLSWHLAQISALNYLFPDLENRTSMAHDRLYALLLNVDYQKASFARLKHHEAVMNDFETGLNVFVGRQGDTADDDPRLVHLLLQYAGKIDGMKAEHLRNALESLQKQSDWSVDCLGDCALFLGALNNEEISRATLLLAWVVAVSSCPKNGTKDRRTFLSHLISYLSKLFSLDTQTMVTQNEPGPGLVSVVCVALAKVLPLPEVVSFAEKYCSPEQLCSALTTVSREYHAVMKSCDAEKCLRIAEYMVVRFEENYQKKRLGGDVAQAWAEIGKTKNSIDLAGYLGGTLSALSISSVALAKQRRIRESLKALGSAESMPQMAYSISLCSTEYRHGTDPLRRKTRSVKDETLGKIATIAAEDCDIDAALHVSGKILDAWVKADSLKNVAVAEMATTVGNRSSIKLLGESLELSRSVEDPADRAELLGRLGKVYALIGDVKKGTELISDAIMQAECIENAKERAIVFCCLAIELAGSKVEQQTERLLGKSFESLKDVSERSDKETVLQGIFISYVESGRTEEALPLMRELLSKGWKMTIYCVLRVLPALYKEHLVEELIELVADFGDPRDEAEYFLAIAKWLSSEGHEDLSFSVSDRALKAAGKITPLRSGEDTAGETLARIAVFLAEVGRSDLALSVVKSIKGTHQPLLAVDRIIQVLDQVASTESAIDFLTRNGVLQSKPQQESWQVTSLSDLAKALSLKEEQLFAESVVDYIHDLEERYRAHAELAKSMIHTGRHDEVIRYLMHIRRIEVNAKEFFQRRRQYAISYRIVDHSECDELLCKLAEKYASQGDLEQARGFLQHVNEGTKKKFLYSIAVGMARSGAVNKEFSLADVAVDGENVHHWLWSDVDLWVGAGFHEDMASLARREGPVLSIHRLTQIASACNGAGRPAEAARLLMEARSLAVVIDDQRLENELLSDVATELVACGRVQEGLQLMENAVNGAVSIEDPAERIRGTFFCVLAAERAGMRDRATALLKRVLIWVEECQEDFGDKDRFRDLMARKLIEIDSAVHLKYLIPYLPFSEEKFGYLCGAASYIVDAAKQGGGNEIEITIDAIQQRIMSCGFDDFRRDEALSNLATAIAMTGEIHKAKGIIDLIQDPAQRFVAEIHLLKTETLNDENLLVVYKDAFDIFVSDINYRSVRRRLLSSLRRTLRQQEDAGIRYLRHSLTVFNGDKSSLLDGALQLVCALIKSGDQSRQKELCQTISLITQTLSKAWKPS